MGLLSLSRKKRSPDNPPKVEQTIIEPPQGWQAINFRELYAYRDLFYFLVLRDIKVIYKQTVLGFAWAVIRPVITMVIFNIVFGNLAEIDSDGVPYAIFNYVAVVPWIYFSSSMTDAAGSLVKNKNMLTKIYIPRLIFPLTAPLAKLVDFMIGFVLVGLLMVYFQITPTGNIVYIPLLIILMMLTASGIGMWLSALSVQYRDIKHAIPFLSQILMYAAPVVWPVSAITERFGATARLLYGFYPMAGVIEGFRAAMLNTAPMPWDLIGMSTITTLLIIVSGAFYFRRMERAFADVA